MAPVNGRAALDPRWARHHKHVVADFMVATILVRRMQISNDPVNYDFTTGIYSGSTVTEVWRGPARIQPFGIIGDQIVGQDPTGRRLMRIQIEEIGTGIKVDDEIEVIACESNPDLMQFRMEVRGTVSSSNAWITDLVAEANVKAHNNG